MFYDVLVIYIKNEEGKAFVHANCVELSGRKQPYSQALYLVLFDTSLESECIFVFKILNKNKSHFWTDLLL
jgi:hypothetical protein